MEEKLGQHRINGAINMKLVDEMLVETVSDTLRDVFSESIRIAFYEYLERNFCISRSKIPERIDEFELALSKTFGQSASWVLTRAIAKRLYQRAGLKFADKPNYSLLQYVRDVEAVLENARPEPEAQTNA